MQREEEGPKGLLDVYIRNKHKQALLVHSPPNANLAQISALVASRFRVPPADQLLFYNGQRVGITPQGELRVADRAVIHLVDRRNLTENLVINVRRLRAAAAEQFRVPASQLIEDFIVRHIRQMEADRPFLVYTGRQLDPRRSFAEEFVENESEIFCLDENKDQLQGERKAKYERRLKETRQAKRDQEIKVRPKEREREKDKKSQMSAHETIKQAEESQQATISISVSGNRRQQKEQVPTPNFKKKNISEQVSAGAGQPPALVVPTSHQNSTSLVTDHFQQNRSTLAPNPFFNEGSSISSICSEENHNPQSSKRLDQPSVMFHSAYIGLTDNPTASRPGSIIANPDQEDEQEAPSRSISFDTRAPELVPTDRHLTALDREEIMEESKEDYSESKESAGQREDGRDLSGYELESIQNHQLSASAELQVEMFDNRADSPPRVKDKREILIEEEGHEDLGVDIQPIAHSHHQIQPQQPPSSLNYPAPQSPSDIMLETPHFDEGQWCTGTGRRVEVLIVQHSQLAQRTQSQVAQEKEQRRTNRNSNFHSSNSSRAREYDINNQYNFGHFERFNHNRFSGYKEPPNQSDAQSSKSDQEEKSGESHLTPHQQYLQVQENRSRKASKDGSRKESEDDHSLNIVQLPIQARIKENSSLLIDCESKSELSNRAPPFRGLQRQESGIDELNKLLEAQPHLDPPRPTPSSSSGGREAIELVRHQHDHPSEQVIETSLNMRMSGQHNSSRGSRGDGNSPVAIKGVRAVQSEESLQKVEVKNSLPYFSSYTRSISNEVRFTSHRQIYSIGDFVFSCEVTPIDPLAFFVEALLKQDAMDVYRSYP